jgi:LCP family protein required for cell wall assembly
VADPAYRAKLRSRPAPASEDSAPADPFEPTVVLTPVAAKPQTSAKTAADEPRKLPGKLLLAGRALVTMAAVAALVVTGGAWGYIRASEASFTQVGALDESSDDITDVAGQYGDENYLIVGTDTRAGASGLIGAGTEEDAAGARADTVMLVHVPADRRRVVAVSFPRDLDVERPECDWWDNDTATYTDEVAYAADSDKLNATYALGGPRCLVKVIQRLSGLKINHFVGIDFAGFEAMVNEIGGVTICSPTPLEDGMLGTILPNAGTQTLDGRTALNFVRARYVEAEGTGDYGRITRQQRFLSALLRGALSNNVLLNPGKLNGFINAFTSATFVENIDTKSLMTLGQSLQDVDAGAVSFITVPTAGTNEWGNEIPRLDDIEAIFQAIIDDQPLPGEKLADPPPPLPTESGPTMVEALDPSVVSLSIANASGVTGAASAAADEMAAHDFQIVSTNTYDEFVSDTVVRYAPGYEAEAATVASAVPGAILESVPGQGETVELIIGTDIGVTVTAPAAVGSQLDATPSRVGKPEVLEMPEDLEIVNAGDVSCA